MEHYLYVFSDEERDELISAGYVLVTADEQQHRYVFENQDVIRFDLNKVKAIPSDILTF